MNNLKHIATACVAFVVTSQVHSADIPTPKDGWVSWQVDAVEDAPAWCCFGNWINNKGPKSFTTCKLDGENHGYGSNDNAKTDAVRVYARFANGKLERLRTLAAACPVEANTPIKQLDNVTTEDSARWLIGLKRDGREEDVLSSLAIHRGELPFTTLKAFARDDARDETRKHAVFWLAVLRGTAGAEVVESTLFNDKDSEQRKHATFAITLSKSPNITSDLIRAGNTDMDGEVRAQAWFWLAHTGTPDAEKPILAALKKDTNDNVREQAVFALSQLPEGRGTKALIAVAEDRSLTHEQRKRAVFWLGQSESADAQAYLDKVLMNTTSR